MSPVSRRGGGRAKRRPDFLVIGAQKAGTTSLYRYLAQHPSIFVHEVKEPHHLCFPADGGPLGWTGPGDDELEGRFARTLEEYEALYEPAGERVTGDFSTGYLSAPGVPERAQALMSQARIIAVLREPVARAESAWWMWRARGVEPLPFLAALEAEPERRAKGWGPTFGYADNGCYARHLRRWLDAVPRERLLVLTADELRARRHRTLARVLEFLGVDPAVELEVEEEHNTAAHWIAPEHLPWRPRSEAAARAWLARFGPGRIGRWFDEHRLPRASHRPSLDPDDRERLRERFEPDRRELVELFDLDLSGW